MRKLLILLFSLLSFSVCIAQSTFENKILLGDVKMREHFYDMAIKYYEQALREANNPYETNLAKDRIDNCYEALEETEKSEEKKKSSSFLFRDQYMETGETASFDDDNKIIQAPEYYQWTLFTVEVYSDYMKILEHKDYETGKKMDDVPPGSSFQLDSQNSEYWLFASDELDMSFLVAKKAHSNTYGSYHEMYRIDDDDVMMMLYSTPELKEKLNKLEVVKEEGVKPVGEDEVTGYWDGEEQQSSERLEISFLESWFLNYNSDMVCLGDSRDDEINASEVCWLTIRTRYKCPEDYSDAVRFDIRLFNPEGKLIVMPGDDVRNGYSSSSVLSARPGGGIFSVSFGSDSPGSFFAGKYIVEIWHGGVCYKTMVINLK